MVWVAVRPPHAPLAPPIADAVFDVVLALSPQPRRLERVAAAAFAPSLLRVRRRLRDFVQLQRELSPAAAADDGDVTCAAIEFLSLFTSDDAADADALARIRVCGVANASHRLAWQLERFLHALLTHASSPRMQNALQRFLRGGEVGGDADAGLLAAALTRERLPAGCATEHAVKLATGAQLVRWRFASEGRGVVFSARFTAAEGGGEENEVYDELDPYAADPYQDENAKRDKRGEWGAAESDECTLFRTPPACTMAHYHTQYAFSRPAAGDQRFVVGQFVARTPGELVLEWENTDTSSVVSKALEYQVVVEDLPHPLEESEEEERGDTAASDDTEDAAWLLSLFADSDLVSVDDILCESGSEDQLYGDDEDNRVEETDARNGVNSCSSASGADRIAGDDHAADQTIRQLEEEAAFHKRIGVELEDRMVQLQEELRVAKSELKKAQDELEISSEIYKASLETITQLEVDSKRRSARAEGGVPSAPLGDLTSSASSISSMEGDKDAKGGTVSAKEHQRVLDLCTTFQEQCLWRSIELSESEKRSLALDSQLRGALDAHAGCQDRLAARDETIVALGAEVKKLKAHKTILVHEVKKLQPYSHVNLSALVQEAQEARMMQRSLQAQLDASQAAVRAMGFTTATSNAKSSSIHDGGDCGAEEDDGAGGGFVVIEPEDRDIH